MKANRIAIILISIFQYTYAQTTMEKLVENKSLTTCIEKIDVEKVNTIDNHLNYLSFLLYV